MADVRPFKGIHYSKSAVKDYSTVICPPHDIINPQQQEELYKINEYNFVRLEYGRTQPDDTPANNRYTRSATTMEQWLKKGIFEADKKPTMYLHDHMFVLEGKEYKRRSLFARVKLEEWDKAIIRPHENTLAVTKSDRLSLIRALQANTSPILAMFEDREQKIYGQTAKQTQRIPIINSRIVNGEGHMVWAFTDEGIINQVTSVLADKPLYIADGHHRYESALAYSKERNKPGDAAFNFVMMELVDFSQNGLKILATHRLVKGLSQATLDGLMPKLEEFFSVEKTSLNTGDTRKQIDDFLASTDGIRFCLIGQSAGSLLKLKLRDPSAAAAMITGTHADIYKKLDVTIIDRILLEKILGMNAEGDKTGLAYNHDLADVVNKVNGGEYQLAVLLSPVTPGTLKAVADAGDKMPPKSTYFYPKCPSGLVFNRLV